VREEDYLPFKMNKSVLCESGTPAKEGQRESDWQLAVQSYRWQREETTH